METIISEEIEKQSKLLFIQCADLFEEPLQLGSIMDHDWSIKKSPKTGQFLQKSPIFGDLKLTRGL